MSPLLAVWLWRLGFFLVGLGVGLLLAGLATYLLRPQGGRADVAAQ